MVVPKRLQGNRSHQKNPLHKTNNKNGGEPISSFWLQGLKKRGPKAYLRATKLGKKGWKESRGGIQGVSISHKQGKWGNLRSKERKRPRKKGAKVQKINKSTVTQPEKSKTKSDLAVGGNENKKSFIKELESEEQVGEAMQGGGREESKYGKRASSLGGGGGGGGDKGTLLT